MGKKENKTAEEDIEKSEKTIAEEEESPKQDKKSEENDYYNQLLRLKADFENYRKRIEKERPDLIKWGKADVLIKLLPLYELLIKAHSHIKKADISADSRNKSEIKEIISGLEMIFKEFSKVFKNEGIKEMKLVGKTYDPMLCEIMQIVDGDEENDGKVLEEFEKGFYYEDKVLRPARVKIAKKKIEEPKKEESEESKEKDEK